MFNNGLSHYLIDVQVQIYRFVLKRQIFTTFFVKESKNEKVKK